MNYDNLKISMPILKIMDEDHKNYENFLKIFSQFDKIKEELEEVKTEYEKLLAILSEYSNVFDSDNISEDVIRLRSEYSSTKKNLTSEMFDLLQANINLFIMLNLDKEIIKIVNLEHYKKLNDRKWTFQGTTLIEFLKT